MHVDWILVSRRCRIILEVIRAQQHERVRATELEHDLLEVASGDLGPTNSTEQTRVPGFAMFHIT